MTNLTDVSRAYPHDEVHMRKYIEYQQRYSLDIRESDKVIIRLISEFLNNKSSNKILDIGCSTGNLLKHLRNCYPNLELTGGDLSALEIESCKSNSSLVGIDFKVMDITDIPDIACYEIVVANAILFALEDDDYARALLSIKNALKPGGMFIAFDWFHPWKQELTILEKSKEFPDGIVLHSRSYEKTTSILTEFQFDSIRFEPFEIPIDLAKPSIDSTSLETYTIKTEDGRKLQFRGVIAQPWTHLTAIRN